MNFDSVKCNLCNTILNKKDVGNGYIQCNYNNKVKYIYNGVWGYKVDCIDKSKI